jgi:hypothetical protein
MAFDPQPHLIQLPRKVKDKATGHYSTVYDDYLEVKWRLCWFRDRYPHGRITTEEVCVDLERGYARYRCVVEDGEGGKATGYGTETKAGFEDYVERAETRALGRALAALGIGTQFVGQDLTEGEHVADAPVVSTHGNTAVAQQDNPPADPSANGAVPVNGTNVPSPPTVIPTDTDLPCRGQLLVDLKPASLSMLIGKLTGLAEAQGGRWVVLLQALQAEREARLARGKRPKVSPVEGAADVP